MGVNTNPLSGVYDDFTTIISSIEIKYTLKAEEFETLEAKQNGEEYIAAIEKRDTFFSYTDYTEEELVQVLGNRSSLNLKEIIETGNTTKIPNQYRSDLLELRRARVIREYNELNDYYRTFLGLPPILESSVNFHYVPNDIAERYGIIADRTDQKVPIHLVRDYFNNKESGKGDYFISILDGLGVIQDLINKYPDQTYLKYITSHRIDIYKLRTAKNFQILYIDSQFLKSALYEKFIQVYEQARDYFVSTIYNYKMRSIINYYDNFIAMCIMIMTINQTIVQQIPLGIKREFYNIQACRMLYEAYSVPYDMNIDEITQRNIAQSLNMLIKDKATNKVLFDISKLLGFEDVEIFNYYLMKDRKFDKYGLPIVEKTYKFNEVTGEREEVYDYDKMYNLYFQKVDINDKTSISGSFYDQTNTVTYDDVTSEDPFWWEDSNLYREIWDSEYNYIETKYLSLNICYRMTEIMYENIILLKMLMDKHQDISSIFISLPKILNENIQVSLFHAIIFLCCLTSKKHKLGGQIISIPSQVWSVLDYLRGEDLGTNELCNSFAFNFNKLKINNIQDEYVNYLRRNNINGAFVYVKCSLLDIFDDDIDYYTYDSNSSSYVIVDKSTIKYPNRNTTYYVKEYESYKYPLSKFKLDVAKGLIETDSNVACMNSVLNTLLSKEDSERLNSYLTILGTDLNNSSTNKEKIQAINKMYNTIKNLGNFISYKITQTDDKTEYTVLRQMYKTLFYSKEMKEIFNVISERDQCWEDTYGNYYFKTSPTTFIKYRNGIIYERNVSEDVILDLVENSGFKFNESIGIYYRNDINGKDDDVYIKIEQTIVGYRPDGSMMTHDEALANYGDAQQFGLKEIDDINDDRPKRTRTAKTFFEYLYWVNPTLYSSVFTTNIDEQYNEYLEKTGKIRYNYRKEDFIRDIYLGLVDIKFDTLIDESNESDINNDRLYYYIDHVIFKIENIIKNLRFIYLLNDTSTPVEDLLLKLIKFFKSYTVDLIGLDILYIFDLKQENILKLIDKIEKINKSISPKDKTYINDVVNHYVKSLLPYSNNARLSDEIAYRVRMYVYDKLLDMDEMMLYKTIYYQDKKVIVDIVKNYIKTLSCTDSNIKFSDDIIKIWYNI